MAGDASSRIAQASITSLAAYDESVTAGWLANSLGVGGEAVGGAGEALGCGFACFAGARADDAALGAVEVLAGVATNGFQYQLLADSIGVFVVAGGTGAGFDLFVVDSVQGAGGATSLEDELVASARKRADSAAAQGVSVGADALSVGDDLVVAAGVAVALAVEQLIRFALAHAGGTLQHSAGRTGAALVAIVDQIARANRADSIDDEAVWQIGAGGADSG